jgi:hypothetical protein
MKLMMDLLIRLQEFEAPPHDPFREWQLSSVEERAAREELDLVRDILPAEVLARYDEMKNTDEDLMESPELFAMTVLSDTYRSLSPSKRKTFLGHFHPFHSAAPHRLSSSANRPCRRNCNGEQHGRWRR